MADSFGPPHGLSQGLHIACGCPFQAAGPISVSEYLPIPTTEQFQDLQISLELEKSLVPYTTGSQRQPSDEVCVV